jgi:hypothetical protein
MSSCNLRETLILLSPFEIANLSHWSTKSICQVILNVKQDRHNSLESLFYLSPVPDTVDSRLSARGLTALRLNRGNVFSKKKIYFP